MDYLYDGTYEGLLTCVYAHYYEAKATGIYPEANYQATMLAPSRTLTTDSEKAQKVYRAIYQKMGHEGMKLVYRSFLSNTAGKENAILQYLIQGFKMGKRMNGLYASPAVYALRQMENDVVAESHRFLGILRFSAIERTESPPLEGTTEIAPVTTEIMPGTSSPLQVLYALLEPDHDVLELMGDHFADRYKNEYVIIHDLKREKAVFARQGSWDIRPLPRDFRALAKADGWRPAGGYETLWKQYFQTIAIKERTNPKCQKNYMPVRYWKNLTEFT